MNKNDTARVSFLFVGGAAGIEPATRKREISAVRTQQMQSYANSTV